jgi:hypothetical protein
MSEWKNKKGVTIFRLKDTFSFGKHRTHTIEDVITEDPRYVEWCRENIDWFKLDKESTEFLDDCLDSRDELDHPYPEDL